MLQVVLWPWVAIRRFSRDAFFHFKTPAFWCVRSTEVPGLARDRTTSRPPNRPSFGSLWIHFWCVAHQGGTSRASSGRRTDGSCTANPRQSPL